MSTSGSSCSGFSDRVTAPGAVSRPRGLLLVEADEGQRASLALGLREVGFEVTTCATSADVAGLLAGASGRYAVIIADLGMLDPCARELLAAAALCPERPCVLLTTVAVDDADEDLAMRLGAAALLERPLDVATLRQRVRFYAELSPRGAGGAL